MKKFLFLLLLALLTTKSFAQFGAQLNPIPWDATRDDVTAIMLSEPGWQLASVTPAQRPGGVSLDMYVYATRSISRAVGWQNGRVFRTTVAFYVEYDKELAEQAQRYADERFEPVGKNEWVDKKTNTRIRRAYDGHRIEYEMSAL